jgi:hypothetical protein
LGSPEDTPKLNFASQPGRNFGPSKSLRPPNRSEPRRTVSGPRYDRNDKGERSKQVYTAQVRNLVLQVRRPRIEANTAQFLSILIKL